MGWHWVHRDIELARLIIKSTVVPIFCRSTMASSYRGGLENEGGYQDGELPVARPWLWPVTSPAVLSLHSNCQESEPGVSRGDDLHLLDSDPNPGDAIFSPFSKHHSTTPSLVQASDQSASRPVPLCPGSPESPSRVPITESL